MEKSVISVNLTNFITIGLMAMIFMFAIKFVATKIGAKNTQQSGS